MGAGMCGSRRLRGSGADGGAACGLAGDDLCEGAAALCAAARATASWTPDSRIALTSAASPEFAVQLAEEKRDSDAKAWRDISVSTDAQDVKGLPDLKF